MIKCRDLSPKTKLTIDKKHILVVDLITTIKSTTKDVLSTIEDHDKPKSNVDIKQIYETIIRSSITWDQ